MRVRYIDNLAKEGEMDLNRVHPGDSVRFIADFRKIAGPKGVVFVPKDTVAEVIGIGPESLRVLTAGAREAAGDLESEDMEVEVEPHVVAVLVDERDERLNNHRIDDAQRVARTGGIIELWDLELALVAGLREGWPMWRRRAAVRQLRGPARRLAERATDQAWRMLVAGLGYDRSRDRAAARFPSGASIPVLQQAAHMMGPAFQAEHGRRPDLYNRQDALWLVQELYAHVQHESSEDALQLDEDENSFTPYGPQFDEYSIVDGPGGNLTTTRGPVGKPAVWERELERLGDTLEAIRNTPESAWLRDMDTLGRPYVGPVDMDEALARGGPPISVPEQPLETRPLPPDIDEQLDRAIERQRRRHAPPGTPERNTAPFLPPEPVTAPAPAPAAPGGRTPILWKNQNKWVIAKPGMPVFLKGKGHGAITEVRPESVTADVDGRPVTSDPRLVYLHAREPLPGMEFATMPEVDEMKRRLDKRRHGSCYVTSPTHDGDNRPTTSYGEVVARGAHSPFAGARPGDTGSGRHSSARGAGPSRDGDQHPVRHDRLASGVHVRPRADEARGSEWGARRTALGPLGVAELKRWLNYPDEFAIISGYKDTQTSKANQTKHGELMQALQKLGYSPGQIRPLRGQYMNQKGEMQAEQSILILGMSLPDALDVGRQLNQESVIYKSPEGVLGAYWTDGSGEVRLALNEGDIALGDQGVQVRPRAPKEHRQGPPSPQDPWSKARSVGFEFPIDWNRKFRTNPGRPLTLEDARRQMSPAPAPAPQEGEAGLM